MVKLSSKIKVKRNQIVAVGAVGGLLFILNKRQKSLEEIAAKYQAKQAILQQQMDQADREQQTALKRAATELLLDQINEQVPIALKTHLDLAAIRQTMADDTTVAWYADRRVRMLASHIDNIINDLDVDQDGDGLPDWPIDDNGFTDSTNWQFDEPFMSDISNWNRIEGKIYVNTNEYSRIYPSRSKPLDYTRLMEFLKEGKHKLMFKSDLSERYSRFNEIVNVLNRVQTIEKEIADSATKKPPSPQWQQQWSSKTPAEYSAWTKTNRLEAERYLKDILMSLGRAGYGAGISSDEIPARAPPANEYINNILGIYVIEYPVLQGILIRYFKDGHLI